MIGVSTVLLPHALLLPPFAVTPHAELSRNPPEGISVGLGDDSDIFKWDLIIVGPPETLYEGGFFAAKLNFPPDFPNSPPEMKFKTAIWHPNGESCLFGAT